MSVIDGASIACSYAAQTPAAHSGPMSHAGVAEVAERRGFQPLVCRDWQ
jgi:hypothetical protein